MQAEGGVLTVPKVLRPWLWSVAWLILISIGFAALLMLNDSRGREEFIAKSKMASHPGINSSGSVPLFVAVGDSLLYFSLPSEMDFGIELDSALGGKVHWLRYWLAGSTLNPFLPILNVKDTDFSGTFFFLQDSMFQKETRTMSSYRIESLKNSIRPLIRAGTPAWDRAFTGYHAGFGFECATLRMDLIESAERRYAALYSFNGNIIRDDSLAYIRALKKNSRGVLVFSLPRARSNIKEVHQEAWRKKLASELHREGIEYVQIGASMPEDHYCRDKGHPNDKGRVLRARQFASLLRRVSTSTH